MPRVLHLGVLVVSRTYKSCRCKSYSKKCKLDEKWPRLATLSMKCMLNYNEMLLVISALGHSCESRPGFYAAIAITCQDSWSAAVCQ